MYEDELRRTERKIKRRNYISKLTNWEIYLFGVSDNTRQIIRILKKIGAEPKNVIDNDKAKQGSYCSGLKVIPFSEIENSSDDNKMYIIYSAYWREMSTQLKEKGISSRNIWILNSKLGMLVNLFIMVYKGKIHYKKIVRKYGEIPIFLCPYTGTGDIYLIGTFWEEYIKRNNITEYVFLVISGACKKVAMLFDIKNIEVIKKKKYVTHLIDYYLYDRKNGYIKILNDCWGHVHTNQVEWFRGYKGLYFTQLFRKFVFGLPDNVKPKHPQFKNEEERIRMIFEQNNLKNGRTVVLSPYSNTLSDFPESFWEQIVNELINRGYVVITNSSGKTEPAIKGTKGIFFPLDIAPQFIETAGIFIGVRSGFCDVISGTKAKKIILYDKGNRFYMGSAYDYFNLRDMELCYDATEIECDVNDTNETYNKVIDEIIQLDIISNER